MSRRKQVKIHWNRFIPFILISLAVIVMLGVAIVKASESQYIEQPEAKPSAVEEEQEDALQAAPVIPEPEPELIEYTITAYCSCRECCGKHADNRPTDEYGNEIVKWAGGVELIQGVHCASPLPFGTVVEIAGIGTYEVQDRTAKWIVEKYDSKIIDLYFEDHQAASAFGKAKAFVEIKN